MRKVLIANRGEIALRIIRACHDLGLETVAVYSEADSESLHVLSADESVCIGKAPSTLSYLKIPNILSAAEITGADAIHPGYGFLAENAKFALICQSCGLTFIGPSSNSISSLGDKIQAKEFARMVKCPTIPGSGSVADVDEATAEAKKIGFPLLIKAANGGGGKGIRRVDSQKELIPLFAAAQSEAITCFGNGDLYLEKLIENPSHIEVQIVADQHGHVIHLAERDCTLQRRRQKLIEEAPSPMLSSALREKMGHMACKLAKKANYSSLGTVEFLLDSSDRFYFMEMNTRIQVEHTITEELTGIDLVQLQIRIACGQKLPLKQKDVRLDGHVIQFRINAEDPAKNFTPSPGVLEHYIPPGGPHVRIDSACYSGYKIPPHYDSMIAKLIVKGKDRNEAIPVSSSVIVCST